MRVPRNSFAAATATLVTWLVPLVSSISVPTGKLTPITPARPTPRMVNPLAPAAPAPVVEYSEDHPEPPPLDPSYVPQTFNYFDTLAKHHIYYFPVRYRNFNAISNQIEYEPPQKYNGQTLGKNIGYKPFKNQLALPYFPARTDWSRQQYNQADNQYNGQQNNLYNNHANNQYNNQPSNQYNNVANNQPSNQYNQASSQVSSDYNNQYNPQPTQQQQQQQQQYEAVSTQSSPASTVPAASYVPQGLQAPQGPPAPQTSQVPKVDYTTGKGSYDVTGKGGSKSEYYTKEDWSKKTSYPKKVLSSRKFPGSKY